MDKESNAKRVQKMDGFIMQRKRLDRELLREIAHDVTTHFVQHAFLLARLLDDSLRDSQILLHNFSSRQAYHPLLFLTPTSWYHTFTS